MRCAALLTPYFVTPGLNRLLDGFSTRGATAVCTFAYCPGPGMEPVLFEGKTEGTIVPARGSTHFGWDAVFQPTGTNLTFVALLSVVFSWSL